MDIKEFSEQLTKEVSEDLNEVQESLSDLDKRITEILLKYESLPATITIADVSQIKHIYFTIKGLLSVTQNNPNSMQPSMPTPNIPMP